MPDELSEQWSLDAAIADKHLDDLRTTERAAIQTHADEIAEAKAERAAKSKQRGECRATLKQLDDTAAEANEADTKKAAAIRKEHKRPSTSALMQV